MSAAGPADRYNPVVDRVARAWHRARTGHRFGHKWRLAAALVAAETANTELAAMRRRALAAERRLDAMPSAIRDASLAAPTASEDQTHRPTAPGDSAR